MPKIAICAALYEAGRPYLGEFLAAVRRASAGHDVVFVGAIDGLSEAAAALADLAEEVEVRTIEVPPGHTPAGVRRYMLTAGQTSGADYLVFVDMDDVMFADALELHLEALRDADFSYGDMALIDRSGTRLQRRFFDGADVPATVDDVSAIRDRNFLGFSNTAVRVRRIAPVALTVPEDIVAADWWFYTMLLLGGLRGRKTAGPVSAYRLHDANTLGAGIPQTASEAIGQAEAMLSHYRAFSALPVLAERARSTELTLVRLHQEPNACLSELGLASAGDAGAWFESINRIARADSLPVQPELTAQ